MEIFVGSGIEARRGLLRIWSGDGLRSVVCFRDAAGRVGHECPIHTIRHRGEFQRRRKSSGDSRGFFGGGEHPLIEGATDAAALILVFDNDEAEETFAGGKAGAHGIDAGEHAVEGEGHVVVFGELEDGEEAFV